jgi:hypothetical protein
MAYWIIANDRGGKRIGFDPDMGHSGEVSFARQVWSGSLEGSHHDLRGANTHEIERRRLFMREHILEKCHPPFHFRVGRQVPDCRGCDIRVGGARDANVVGPASRP